MWKGPATLRSSVRFTWCGAGAGAGVGGSIGAGGLAVLAFVDAVKTMKATAIKIENCIFAIASLTFSSLCPNVTAIKQCKDQIFIKNP